MKNQIKIRNINWGILAIFLIVVGVIAVVVGFIGLKKLQSDDYGNSQRTDLMLYQKGEFEQLKVSEDRKWFLLPEFGIKFPFSEEVAFRDFGRLPEYRLLRWGDEDVPERRNDWEIRLTYHMHGLDIEDNDEWLLAPITIVRSTVDRGYEVDDIHGEDWRVRTIIDVHDGSKIYLTTNNFGDTVNDNGVYIYENLLSALDKIQLY